MRALAAKTMAAMQCAVPTLFHTATTRFSADEVKRINAHCRRFNIPRAALLRQAALLVVEDAEREVKP